MRDAYFFSIHSIFLAVVLIGFSSSFYLRPFSDQAELPLYLRIHGLACTSWFIGILLQSYLIRSKQLDWHKKLGPIFTGLVPVIVLSGFWLTYYRIEKYYLGSSEFALQNPDRPEFESMLIWGDVLILLLFLGVVYMGYKQRYQLNFHKRYMLFASILIVPQAFIRLGKIPFLMLGNNPAASGSIYAVLGPVLVLLSLLGYDKSRLGRIHKATKISWLLYLSLLISTVLIMRTGIGEAILEAIKWTS
ncbi:MAG: hypothetical protein AAF696_02015 [Bacteroidota bacterium]